MGKVNEVDAQFAVRTKWISSPSYMRMINTLCLSLHNQQQNISSEVALFYQLSFYLCNLLSTTYTCSTLNFVIHKLRGLMVQVHTFQMLM